MSPAKTDPTATLLPPVTDLRRVAVLVARAVARQARAEGLCDPLDDAQIDARIDAKMWEPSYPPYRRRSAATPVAG